MQLQTSTLKSGPKCANHTDSKLGASSGQPFKYFKALYTNK